MIFFEHSTIRDVLAWAVEQDKVGFLNPESTISWERLVDTLLNQLPARLPPCPAFETMAYFADIEQLAFVYGENGDEPITDLSRDQQRGRLREYLPPFFLNFGFDPAAALSLTFNFYGEVHYELLDYWDSLFAGARIVICLVFSQYLFSEADQALFSRPTPEELLSLSISPYIHWQDNSRISSAEAMLQTPLLAAIEFYSGWYSDPYSNPFVGQLVRDAEALIESLTIPLVDYPALVEVMAMGDFAQRAMAIGASVDDRIWNVFADLTKFFDLREEEEHEPLEDNIY